LHTVAKKETIFNLCKTYNITLQELQAANPELGGVLQAGSTVKIPVSGHAPETQKKESSASPSSATEFYYHKVQKKQTLFSIAKQYGIAPNDVIRFNPESSNGLKIGEILKIPVNPKITDNPAILAESSKSANFSGFLSHRVAADETIFGLEKQYGVTDEELLKLNPDLKNGLKIGMILKIPEKQKITAKPISGTNQVGSKYQVEKGETIFSIAARFGVEVSDLKNANPILFSRGLETGETILIPQRSTAGSTASQPMEYKPVVSQVPVYQESVTSGNCLPQPNSFKK